MKIKLDFNTYIHNIEAGLLNNPKDFCGVIKKVRMKNKSPLSMHLGDKEFTGGDKIAEALANYFHSVYEPNNLNFNDLLRQALCSPVMENVHTLFISDVSEREVLSALDKLKSKRSVGPDNIPLYILKGCADSFVKPLHFLFNH